MIVGYGVWASLYHHEDLANLSLRVQPDKGLGLWATRPIGETPPEDRDLL